ncbi:hypothetical protein RFI_30545 [Reticulomyxa filosa]|uniref:Uncharacterized protein n=1 Tax=Reticulomyxa filosa TaxID=46433 RepID=X6M0C9_RETFI|nr:hypothetical protein RFI_30545 [Reticulomyxa filosa]|eukprot:ETO06847.1 hypothetical protein RFI_30545 [Reticulomyxa filosa]
MKIFVWYEYWITYTRSGGRSLGGKLQQQYTVRGGRRPFGLSTLIGGWNVDGKTVQLYQTTPSGIYSEWKANAIGRKTFLIILKKKWCDGQDKMLNEFLEKHYTDDLTIEAAVKLAIRALLEVVEHGAKNIDVGILEKKKALSKLQEADIEKIVEEIKKEEELEDGNKEKEKEKNQCARFVKICINLSTKIFCKIYWKITMKHKYFNTIKLLETTINKKKTQTISQLITTDLFYSSHIHFERNTQAVIKALDAVE